MWRNLGKNTDTPQHDQDTDDSDLPTAGSFYDFYQPRFNDGVSCAEVCLDGQFECEKALPNKKDECQREYRVCVNKCMGNRLKPMPEANRHV